MARIGAASGIGARRLAPARRRSGAASDAGCARPEPDPTALPIDTIVQWSRFVIPDL